MNETVKIIFDILQTIILGIGMWYIQRSAKKRDEKRDRQNIADNTWKQCITKGVDGNSSLALQEAKYIKIYHPEVNGDLAIAQQYVLDNKHEMSNFLTKQGLENILNN